MALSENGGIDATMLVGPTGYNNSGWGYPVPVMGGYGNGGFGGFGGDWGSLIVLFLIAAMFGGFGGEPILTSRAIVTPAAVDEYFNVTSTAIITVPKGCCFNVSAENTSEATDATTPAPAINVQNANMTVTRIA